MGDKEIAAKSEERSIAAQQAISALRKKKEPLMKETKLLAGAISVVGKAIAKLQRAVDLGVDDWSKVHTEKIKLSSFARKKLADPEALAELRRTCDGANILLKDDSLEFAGDKDKVK